MTDPLPLVCTLTPEAIRAGRAGLLPGLMAEALERLELPHGWRLRFEDDGILARIAAVLETERRCCQFLRFQVEAEPQRGPVWLEISGPPGTRAYLAALFEE